MWSHPRHNSILKSQIRMKQRPTSNSRDSIPNRRLVKVAGIRKEAGMEESRKRSTGRLMKILDTTTDAKITMKNVVIITKDVVTGTISEAMTTTVVTKTKEVTMTNTEVTITEGMGMTTGDTTTGVMIQDLNIMSKEDHMEGMIKIMIEATMSKENSVVSNRLCSQGAKCLTSQDLPRIEAIEETTTTNSTRNTIWITENTVKITEM